MDTTHRTHQPGIRVPDMRHTVALYLIGHRAGLALGLFAVAVAGAARRQSRGQSHRGGGGRNARGAAVALRLRFTTSQRCHHRPFS